MIALKKRDRLQPLIHEERRGALEAEMEIFIDNRQQTHQVDLTQLEQVAQHILRDLQCEERCELSVVLVGDAEMRQLNREYRGIDRSTDVLSFAQQETIDPQLVQPHCDDAIFPLLLGDVIISVETTEKQAKEHETTFEREFYFLLIHGILHLLGHDHHTAAESRAMKRLEQELFATVRNSAKT